MYPVKDATSLGTWRTLAKRDGRAVVEEVIEEKTKKIINGVHIIDEIIII